MIVPAPRFSNDDEAAEHWLTVLRDGNPEQKRRARERLAEIFERRQMFEEATELLISNIRDGERTADVFRWLARLYRAQGDEALAAQAAAEAAKYLAPMPGPLPGATAPLPIVAAPVVNMPAQQGICPACGYTNRNARSTCKRCRAPLSDADTAVRADPPPETTEPKRQSLLAGQCRACRYVNINASGNCRRCGTPYGARRTTDSAVPPPVSRRQDKSKAPIAELTVSEG